MPDLHHQLRVRVAHIARRPLPTPWTNAEPVLTRYSLVKDLHLMIRRNDPEPATDQAIRALVRLARLDSDAAAILLDALVPAINRSIGPRTTAAFRREVLTELAAVILEVDHPENLDDLARRLARRAYRRTTRRIRAEAHHQGVQAGIEDADAVPSPHDVESRVLDRIQLGEIGRQLRQAVDEGRLSTQTVTAFFDGKLFPALTGSHLRMDRRTTYGATRVIRRQLEHTC